MLVSVFVFSSCYREEDFDFNKWASTQDIEYDLALPIFETRLSINNILYTFGQAENFPADPETGLVHIVYAMPEAVQYEIGSSISFSDIKLPAISSGNLVYWMKDTAVTTEVEGTVDLGIKNLKPDAQLDNAKLESIDLSVSGQYTLAMASKMEVSFENIYQDGKPIVIKIGLEGGTNVNYSETFKDVEIRFAESDTVKNPELSYKITCTSDFNTASNEYPDVRTGSFRFQAAAQNIKYKSIEGYMGVMPISFVGDLPVIELTKWNIKDLQFYEGYIKMYSTVYGCSVPILINSSNIKCYFKSPKPGSADIPLFPENYILPYPEATANPLEQKSQVEADIKDLLIQMPYKFEFGVNATVNGDTTTGKQTNIIERNSGLKMNMVCDIPLRMRIDDCEISDTINFGGVDKIETIKQLILKGIVTNAFPIEMIVSIDFLDERGNVLFSPISRDTVGAGVVGPAPDLHVIEPTIYRFDRTLTFEELQMLQHTKLIRVWAVMSTYKDQEAMIYANSDKEGFLGVKMGARAVLQLGSFVKPKGK